MIIGLFIFILGLCIGSFINAFLWRYETGKSLSGRSVCPKCNRTIAWYDNIPLISYILLSGKCRGCGKKISIQYPLIELITGCMFVAAGVKTGIIKSINIIISESTNTGLREYINLGTFLILCFVFALLIIIAVYDYKKREIPNGFNLFFILTSIVYLLIITLPPHNYQLLGHHVVSAFVAFLFFYAFVYFSKETWMGGGDAKLAIGIGLLLGPANTFLAIFFASIIGSIYGMFMILATRDNKNNKIRLSSEIPFGPFLVLGTTISLLFGYQIISWYAKIFLGL